MKFAHFKPAIVLCSICIAVGLLLSLVNMLTAPIIQAATDAAANEALLVVLPDGKTFEKITIDDSYPAIVKEGYRSDAGFVFQMSVTGKSSGLIIMCGISKEGKIVGTKVIADQETDSYAAKVFPSVEGLDGVYKDMDLSGFAPHLVAGATLTSKAYGEAIKAALQAFAIANGGSVDLRTPEQILQENCNAALGTTGVTFSRWFATEIVEGIDAVYTAADNSGRVYVIGESFIGVKADGTVVNLGSASEAVIKAADALIKASTLTEITTIPEGINTKTVKKIYVTSTGNYVFELEAKGYQSLTSYGNGTPIKIRLSISAEGKIIDCLTVSHAESKGFGDVCATEEYYEEFRGASASDITVSVVSPDDHLSQITPDNTDIGAISGATFTTYGYQKAVKAAFEAYELLIAGGEEA
ncbi:MAG: FMN-binding protein [Clostridia bacterium]|nr:FMN-binding protein [Clostridia bacterium]